MASKMLIDAAHPEETRVVVIKGNRVEEFDYESASKKQLRGNIYLAKVTRVEPSLQAAFVDYGGNRHGFLAFTEIHPDYYQIPVADRQALLEEEAEEQSRASAAEAAEDDAAAGRRRGRRRRGGRGRPSDRPGSGRDADRGASEAKAEAVERIADIEDETPEPGVALEASDLVHEVSEPAERPAKPDEEDEGEDNAPAEASHHEAEEAPHHEDEDDDDEAEPAEIVGQPVAVGETNGDVAVDSVESVGSEDVLEEVPERARRRRGRPYKIQEVIRRRQIILVQVVKEERGNKGAALTTYLSLAGRYTVLMPNTARGGGISRKITQPPDRKRLREIAGELEVPEGMGLIIRTAGAQRTKTEIKRDYDYLLRLWENVRDLTLKSSAPTLVYEEGSLIKRSIRDLYNKDIDEVLVAGDDAYREAKDFMRMLMPSHAKNVKPYKEPEPIFIRNQVERHLAAMFSPQVTLKSGGYIVINQTEALVSIDVNSGKATREHNIEDTALKTNLEAAEEIARQLRLRDLAGLIVIDFIDMDERRNNRLVERRIKESLRNDRARIQVGRISHFGLMEMSRQRLRTGMLEGSTTACPMCQGTGAVRSVESVALDILRSIEDRLITDGVVPLVATTAVEVALYILNQKRAHLKDIEQRYRIPVTVTADEDLHVPQFVIERGAATELTHGESAVVHMDWAHHHPTQAGAPGPTEPAAPAAEVEGEQAKRRSRRRRRGRGRGRPGEHEHEHESAEAAPVRFEPAELGDSEDEDEERDSEIAATERAPRTSTGGEPGGQARKPRRRGRRGGRRRAGQQPERGTAEAEGPAREAGEAARPHGEAPRGEAEPGETTPRERSPDDVRTRASEATRGAERPDGQHNGRRQRGEPEPRAEFDAIAAAPQSPTQSPEARPEARIESETPAGPPRRGWWSR